MTSAGSFIVGRDTEFLGYLKQKFPLYHLSNVFFRDLHYGVMGFLEKHAVKSSYVGAEEVTREVIGHFEEAQIFRRVDEKTWLLLYPDFKAVSAKPAAPPKPAPAPRPAPAAPESQPQAGQPAA